MNYSYLCDIFHRRWWIVALSLILALLLYLVTSFQSTQTATYESAAGLFILPTAIQVELEPQLKTVDTGLPRDTGSKVDRRQALLALVKSPIIAQRVFDELKDDLPSGFDEPNSLLPRITGSVGGEVLLIHTTFADPKLATDVANAWAKAYESEANAIFGSSIPPNNLDTEVEAALRSYKTAEDRYVRFLAESPLLELQRRLDDGNSLLDQILSDRLNNSDAIRLRLAELDRLLVDVRSLHERLQTMDKPDVSVYLAYLLLQNAALVQEGVIAVDGTSDAGGKLVFNNLLDTSLLLDPAQISTLIQNTTIADMIRQLEGLITSIENKHAVLDQVLLTQVPAGDATPTPDATVTQLESEVRALQSEVETETEGGNRLQLERDAAKNTYKVLLNKLEEVRVASSIGEGSIVRFAFPATPEILQSNTKRPLSSRGVLTTLLMSFLTSLGIVAVLEFLDNKLRTAAQIEKGLDTSPLGVLPDTLPTELGQPIALVAPFAPYVEGVRYLRTRLHSRYPELRTLLITSILPHEGKTSLAANLAVIMALNGQRVILVDANLRAPLLHESFSLSNRIGLSTWLAGEDDSAAAFLQDTSVAGLQLLPAGPRSEQPAELLDSARMDELLKQLRDRADIVLIDGRHILGTTDALVIARKVEGTLLLIRVGKETVARVKAARQEIEELGGRVVGLVLNATARAEGQGEDMSTGSVVSGWMQHLKQLFGR